MSEDVLIGSSILVIVLLLILGLMAVIMLTGAPRKIEPPKKKVDKNWKEKWLR